ncbi:MAG TPA: hypothetical protein VGR14_11280 [Verrucomicrobiae bacterium]|nr:hypothetical protein [Verrucomicrobiae bacterium]
MMLKNSRVVCLSVVISALAAGCTVTVGPPVVAVVPPGPAVVEVGVPDAYVWDGFEFVGFVGGRYMYLGPGGGWLVCEPWRLDRFHGWERGHADWRNHAVRNEGRDARGRGPARREEERR